MYGCFERLLKTFLGLILIAILLLVGSKMLTEPFKPQEQTTWQQPVDTPKAAPDYGEYHSQQSKEEIKYEVPVQTGPDHDYIMENTFQKSGVVMELTPSLEKGLVLVIKTFKTVLGPDFSPTIISAHDTYHENDEWTPHRSGRAVDIRLNDIPLKEKRKVMKFIQANLPPEYKAIWENQYLPTEMLHLQSKH